MKIFSKRTKPIPTLTKTFSPKFLKRLVHFLYDFGREVDYSKECIAEVWGSDAIRIMESKGCDLPPISGDDHKQRVSSFFDIASTKQMVDFLEALFRSEWHRGNHKGKSSYEELNIIFREEGIAWQISPPHMTYPATMNPYPNSEILDNVVNPVLAILTKPEWVAVDAEVRGAIKDFKKGDYKNTIAGGRRALESTLKTICNRKGWSYNPKGGLAKLLTVVIDKGLFPDPVAGTSNCYHGAMLNTTGTIGNNVGAHGQSQIVTITQAQANHLMVTLCNIQLAIENSGL